MRKVKDCLKGREKKSKYENEEQETEIDIDIIDKEEDYELNEMIENSKEET